MKSNTEPSSPPSSESEGAVVLHQFPFSHYNEKARWGLDFKGLSHQRKNYLPGPHAGAIQRLSGQSSTPVLCVGDRVVVGSSEILRALEDMVPAPALLPENSAERAQALELEARYDGDLSPAIRTAIFSVMLHEPGYMCAMFSSPQPVVLRWMYRALFPVAKGKVERAYQTDSAQHVEHCCGLVDRTLDEIVERTQDTGYHVGGTFTVADLAAAALLAPVANPDHPDMRRPTPQPARVTEFTERWHAHPAAEWARSMYAAHRPASLG